MFMKKLILTLLIFILSSANVFAASYIKIKPEKLTQNQTSDFETLNSNLDKIFYKIKASIKTDKYPKYYHNYTLLENDGTHSDTYNYVLYNNAELVFNTDTNDLKYISFRRPELCKCRILYDYPSGNLHAVEIFSQDSKSFVFSADGKYVDYEPYIKQVEAKVLKNWKMPSRKKIASDKKDTKISIQAALNVNKEGKVEKIRILKSSNINELDDSIYDAVKAASPFEKFPQNFFNEQITIIMNFNVSL